MARSEALSVAGQPDRLEPEVDPSIGARETWNYREFGVGLDFDEDDAWRLVSITWWSSSIRINGAVLVDCRAGKLACRAAEVGITDVQQTDDFEELGKCHNSDQPGLQFWEEAGRIVNVTLFPRYNETGIFSSMARLGGVFNSGSILKFPCRPERRCTP